MHSASELLIMIMFHMLFQWGGLLLYLRLGADGHRDRPVCRRWQRGEDGVRTARQQTAVQGVENKLFFPELCHF